MAKYSHEKGNSDNPIHNSSKVDYRYSPSSNEESYSTDIEGGFEYDSQSKKYNRDQRYGEDQDDQSGEQNNRDSRMATPALIVVIIMWFMMFGAIIATALDLWPE